MAAPRIVAIHEFDALGVLPFPGVGPLLLLVALPEEIIDILINFVAGCGSFVSGIRILVLCLFLRIEAFLALLVKFLGGSADPLYGYLVRDRLVVKVVAKDGLLG